MWILLCLAGDASADSFFGVAPRPRGAQTLVVTDPAAEGPFKLVMPGQEGSTVYADGWKLGVLPLETVLAEGLHTFRIESPKGAVEIEIQVTPSAQRTVELDLTPPPAPDPTTGAVPKS
jgi:hypothetical protein